MSAQRTPARPGGTPDSMVRRLKTLAQRAAQRAAEDLGRGHLDECMAGAGIALEHMAKAFLIRQHPLLVVATTSQGRMDLDGMKAAIRGELPPDSARSISADEAIRRCCALLPELDAQALRPVIEARNGVLHIGQSEADANRVIASLASAARVILPEIASDPKQLWGHYYDAVMGRLNEYRTEIAHRVADRRARCADNWEVRFKTVGVEGLNELHRSAEAQPFRENERPMRCPACQSTAIAAGHPELEVGAEVQRDDNGRTTARWVTPYFQFHQLRCLMCGFWLDGIEEIEAAGLKAVILPSDDVNPSTVDETAVL